MIKIMLEPSNRLRCPNLLGSHPRGEGQVYQFDCNGGTLCGISEMLVSSPFGEINLLPALPEKWQSGSICGIRARGGFIVTELEWNNGSLTKTVIKSENGGTLKVKYGTYAIEIDTSTGGIYEFDSQLILKN